MNRFILLIKGLRDYASLKRERRIYGEICFVKFLYYN